MACKKLCLIGLAAGFPLGNVLEDRLAVGAILTGKQRESLGDGMIPVN
jgi:hypothetical protein